MILEWPPRRTLFSDEDNGWKIGRDSQLIIRKMMGTLIGGLGRVGPIRRLG